MSIRQLVLFAALAVCGWFLVQALPRLTGPERYSIPFNRYETVPYAQGLEMALRPGERGELYGNFYVSGGYSMCLHWDAEYGAKSVYVEASVARSTNRNDLNLIPMVVEPLCIQNQNIRGTILNVSDKPQFVRFVMIREPANRRAGYGIRGRNFTSIKSVRDYPSIPEVKAEGRENLVKAGGAGVVALAAFVGVPAFLGFIYASWLSIRQLLYRIGRKLLPSKRAHRVAEALKTANRGQYFDATATDGYEQKPTSGFRQQQDIDDLQDLVADIKKQTSRLKETEDKIKATKQADVVERARLNAELEAAIRRVKELQEELEKRGV